MGYPEDRPRAVEESQVQTQDINAGSVREHHEEKLRAYSGQGRYS